VPAPPAMKIENVRSVCRARRAERRRAADSHATPCAGSVSRCSLTLSETAFPPSGERETPDRPPDLHGSFLVTWSCPVYAAMDIVSAERIPNKAGFAAGAAELSGCTTVTTRPVPNRQQLRHRAQVPAFIETSPGATTRTSTGPPIAPFPSLTTLPTHRARG